jgi:hypothetical protein
MASSAQRRFSNLTAYSDVVSLTGKGAHGAGGPFDGLNRGTSDSLSSSLAFRYDFELEEQAIKDFSEWEKQRGEKERRLQFFREMFGGNSGVPEQLANNRATASATARPQASRDVRKAAEPAPYEASVKTADSTFPAQHLDLRKIAQFREYTGASESRAIQYLRSYDWNVDSAVKHFFENS